MALRVKVNGKKVKSSSSILNDPAMSLFFIFQVLRDVALKRELAIWLDAKLTDIEKRHNLDAKNAALLRTMAIKRLSKFKKGKKEASVSGSLLRRAHR